MKHVDELTLLAIAKNSLREDDAKNALLHVKQCGLCSKKLQMIQATIAPQKLIEPSRDILSSILEYHSKSESKKESFFDGLFNFIQTYKRSLAFTTGIVILSIAVVLFSIKPNYKSIPHILYIAGKTNNIVTTQTIKEGHRILLNESDSAVLIANNDIRFMLAGAADLTVSKSRYNTTVEKKKFQYILSKGIANIKSYSPHDTMQYEIKTPDAIVQPLGTEFYINVSPEGSHIYIVEGAVKILNTVTNETVEAETGKLYTISKNEITSFDIEKYELQWVNDIDGSFMNFSDNLDYGEYSAINSNINDNTGKGSSTENRPKDVTSPDMNKETESLKNKNEILEMKELQNEMRQLKKESKHKQGK
ncbi:MAG: FecR domain-containing protein [Spirochaetota bacterium]